MQPIEYLQFDDTTDGRRAMAEQMRDDVRAHFSEERRLTKTELHSLRNLFRSHFLVFLRGWATVTKDAPYLNSVAVLLAAADEIESIKEQSAVVAALKDIKREGMRAAEAARETDEVAR